MSDFRVRRLCVFPLIYNQNEESWVCKVLPIVLAIEIAICLTDSNHLIILISLFTANFPKHISNIISISIISIVKEMEETRQIYYFTLRFFKEYF